MPQRAPIQSITLGDATVTYLPDGTGRFLATATFPNSGAEAWQDYQQYVDDEQRMVTSIGGFLIQIGDRNIIMDTGTGPVTIDFPGFGPLVGGDYPASFAATGISRDEVTDVIFTHLHLDHVGWTSLEVDGKRELMFPNARHMVTKSEWDFWYGGDNPAGPHPEWVQGPLQPIIQFVAPGDEIAPGLRLIDTPGHTPGHVSLMLTQGAQRLCLAADIVHVAAQLEHTEWTMAFDVDPTLATASRAKLLALCADANAIVAANHFSDTVFGRVSRGGDGDYHWHPLS